MVEDEDDEDDELEGDFWTPVILLGWDYADSKVTQWGVHFEFLLSLGSSSKAKFSIFEIMIARNWYF